jgi:hypothetical protein
MGISGNGRVQARNMVVPTGTSSCGTAGTSTSIRMEQHVLVRDELVPLPGNSPDGIDPGLWIVAKNHPDPWFLYGNCHTFPGRMKAWNSKDGRDVCVSLFEIVSCSRSSYWWIKGFLAGNEPEPPEDEAEAASWAERRDAFYETGDWRVGN